MCMAGPATSILALAVLGIINTGVAHWVFYLLIYEAEAVQLTIGVIAGLILIAVGAWLATRQLARTGVTAARPGRGADG